MTDKNNKLSEYIPQKDTIEDQKFLDFEKPIQEISEKILALKNADIDSPELNTQILTLQKERDQLTKKIYSKLSIWQTVQVARHPQRPHTLDFISRIFSDFDELHGDRQFADDAAIVGGIAYLENTPVMIIGHEKGRETEEKVSAELCCGHQSAPSVISGKPRRVWSEHLMTQVRVNAVCSNDQIRLNSMAICQG